MAEHHPLASRYTLLSAHCLISVLSCHF